jgi:hypothetical protein
MSKIKMTMRNVITSRTKKRLRMYESIFLMKDMPVSFNPQNYMFFVQKAKVKQFLESKNTGLLVARKQSTNKQQDALY